MPRRPRVFVEGAVYHVYNRLARGADIFAHRKASDRFLDLVARARDRDGLAILAWCLMSNHYHLVLRAGAVPLSRTLGFVQSRFGQAHNRSTRSSGPLWQSRYKAKLVTDERHLMHVIAYVHLNPVTAGIVADPARYALSGHAELLGRTAARLVEVKGTLALFGSTLAAARHAYLDVVKGDRAAPWIGEAPGGLPWWPRERDTATPVAPAEPALDSLGQGADLQRPRLEADAFVERACSLLGVEPACLSSLKKDAGASEVRYLVGGLAIERWRIGASALAQVVERLPEVVSRWAARAGERRQTDEEFSRRYEALDRALAGDTPPGTQHRHGPATPVRGRRASPQRSL